MAQTATRLGSYNNTSRTLRVFTETGSANTQLASVFASARGNPFRLVCVTVSYSAAPTQAGVTTTLTANAGAAFNATLNTGAANAQYTVYVPTGDLIFGPSDKITVTAPAGGAAITASVQIYIEEL